MSKKDACIRVAHRALHLEEFDYKIEHLSGTLMRHADALNCNPVECFTLRKVEDTLTAQIKRTQAKDPKIQVIIKSVRYQNNQEFILSNGVLYKRIHGDLLLVVSKAMQQEVILQIHERGYFG